jgi:N-acetylornithine carbamoyltransferase
VYHPKGLNTAVANSAGIIASKFGMNIVVANPPGYSLDEGYINIMKENCQINNSSFETVNNMEKAFEGADFVYAKSWGSLSQYGNFNKELHDTYKDWIVDTKRMNLTNNAYFSHCLPMRRNVKATDEVIDSDFCTIYEEAENRLHVQKAILTKLLGGKI